MMSGLAITTCPSRRLAFTRCSATRLLIAPFRKHARQQLPELLPAQEDPGMTVFRSAEAFERNFGLISREEQKKLASALVSIAGCGGGGGGHPPPRGGG